MVQKMVTPVQCGQCHVLTLGKIENIVHSHRYELYDEELDHVFEETDLGVTIDHELKFEDHISKKVSKANSIVGLIDEAFRICATLQATLHNLRETASGVCSSGLVAILTETH